MGEGTWKEKNEELLVWHVTFLQQYNLIHSKKKFYTLVRVFVWETFRCVFAAWNVSYAVILDVQLRSGSDVLPIMPTLLPVFTETE